MKISLISISVVLVVLFLTADLCSASSQCRSRDLPLLHSGEKLPSSGVADDNPTCSSNETEKQAALERLNNNVDQLIDSVLPDIKVLFSPSPCDGFGWTQVGFLDMKNTSHNCPSPLELDESANKRTCRIPRSKDHICESTFFSTNNLQYNRICGRITGYQYGTTEAFAAYTVVENNKPTIDDVFVDGVVITRGSPRRHIWTFASGLDETRVNSMFVCPCVSGANQIEVPPFIGTNYFCESAVVDYNPVLNGIFTEDPLWDGQGCGLNNNCCVQNFPPYFISTLDEMSCDDIEVRVCINEQATAENIHIELIELYVK